MVYQEGADKGWAKTRRILDQAVFRDNLETKFDKMMAFKKTSDERTARVAGRMSVVSRRKGRRSMKQMPLKQRKALEAQEEYVLSGAKAAMQVASSRHPVCLSSRPPDGLVHLPYALGVCAPGKERQ